MSSWREVSLVAVSVSKIWKVLAALIACLIAVAAVVCLVHTDGFAETHTPLQGHHHSSSSSSVHLMLDLHCLVAVLPAVIVLLALCLDVFYLHVLWSQPQVPSFPPFIPPKALLHA
ncbi:MAG TPA: hypothetical protein VLQ80_08135 [Candidatus Saccharimonadia bacterium]|nr:hypothetical protein [Candidatus Saccharimonadia bacterium]